MENPLRAFSKKRQFVRIACFFAGIAMLAFALLSENYQSSTQKILFVIDNSLSMAVQDVSLSESEGFVSRLEGAKKLAERFLSIKPETVETGIVTFSRLPTLILPFTTDSMLSKNTIVGIAPLIYGGGSNLVNVVNMIDEVYGNVPNLHVVILSDGEFFDLKNVSSFKNRSAKITLVGVGTENGGHMLE